MEALVVVIVLAAVAALAVAAYRSAVTRVTVYEYETAALRNLANAARAIEGNPMLLQLRLLQELGKTGGNTVVLGLPSTTTPLPLRDTARADVPDELEGGAPPDA